MEGSLALSAPWSFACPDWYERLKHGRSIVPDLPLDRAMAQRAVDIFNNLRLPDVVNQPEMRAAAGEWFRDIIRAAFGSIDPETGRRRVGEIFLLVSKKNSKTTGGAAIMITAMLMNERPNAEMILIGPTQEIADIAFSQAKGMIEADAMLSKRFKVIEHQKKIEDLRRLGATLKVKTFDMRVVTGGKAVVVLIDEIHILSTFSYASNVMMQIRGGFMANPESLLIMISSQSDKPPAGLFKTELDYARAVRDGRITKDVRLLPVLYEFPEEMQTDKKKPWEDPHNWPLVHPNLGRSISIERLIEGFTNAKDKGADTFRIWASQFLGIEVGLALHAARWRGADYWEAAREPKLTLATLLERSEVVTVGVDGGGLDDLLGLAVLGRCAETSKWLVWIKAWVQKSLLTLRPDIAERLTDFAADGDLVICAEPGTQDVHEVAEIISQIDDAELLPPEYGVGLDSAGVSAIIDALADREIQTSEHGGPVCSVFQGYRLSGAIWGAERKLADGTLRHCGQPLLNWCVGNARAELKGNAVLITKEVAGKAKIDPLQALFNAVWLMNRAPESEAGWEVEEDYEAA